LAVGGGPADRLNYAPKSAVEIVVSALHNFLAAMQYSPDN
jgi:hypothetical protein